MTHGTDEYAIEALTYEYAAAVDARAGDALAGLFAPGGRIRVFSMDRPNPVVEFDDPGRLAGMVAQIAQTYAATMHVVTNHTIAIDGDTATGTSACVAHHYFESEERTENEVLPLRYHDSYVRCDDGWRFALRDIHRLWSEFHPASRRPLTVDLVAAGRIAAPGRA